jgi:tRNA(Ile)-lysidine synthase
LLCLLHERLPRQRDIRLHVVHLDHETRGSESAADASFVSALARQFALPCTIQTRRDIERGMKLPLSNPSARYRAARLELFRRVVGREQLAGVLLAHHADDQAETVFLRLLRGSGPVGLGGMRLRTRIGGVALLRPLLSVPREILREFLEARGQAWRDDASNRSPRYLRNRVRMLLADRRELRDRLLEMGEAMGGLRQWIQEESPALEVAFAARRLCDVPELLAREASRRWLVERGVRAQDLAPDVLERLITMARDAASPAQADFPGRLRVRRRRQTIFVEGETASG